MHRRTPITLLAIFAFALAAMPATADEMGGSGFAVPQNNEWLWGIEGLVRTPLDISAGLGVAFIGYEVNGRAVHDDRFEGGAGAFSAGSDTLNFDTQALEGGIRVAGLIGYWNCCVLIEPAMTFRMNRPFGEERNDDTPSVFDPNDGDEFAFAEVEIRTGWDLAFGPQLTWMIRDDTPLIGSRLGGLPMVFFPYLGVTHTEWDVEMLFSDNGNTQGVFDRNYEDDSFMIGFDLDFPLPGSHWNFTHALTFGFRWVKGEDDHDLGPFLPDQITPGVLPTSAPPNGCAIGQGNGFDDQVCFNMDAAKGWRVGLYYRVTWNDFGGFFKRVVFGPVE